MILVLTPNPALDKVTLVAGFRPGGTYHAEEPRWFAGGKGFHLCRALINLGESPLAIAPLGGQIGRLVGQMAEAEGIIGNYHWIAGETRTGLVIIDRGSGQITEVYEKGPELTEQDWAELEARTRGVIGTAPPPAFLAVSGSFPTCLSGCELSDLVRRSTGAGVPVLLDTYGKHLEKALEAEPFLVKINQFEAGDLLGKEMNRPEDALAAAREIRDRGARAAVITLSAAGAVGVDQDGRGFGWSAPDAGGFFPVGSGDSFFAGVTAGLAHGDSLVDAVRLGTAVGTANTLSIGPGVFDSSDVDRLLAQVQPLPLS